MNAPRFLDMLGLEIRRKVIEYVEEFFDLSGNFNANGG